MQKMFKMKKTMRKNRCEIPENIPKTLFLFNGLLFFLNFRDKNNEEKTSKKFTKSFQKPHIFHRTTIIKKLRTM